MGRSGGGGGHSSGGGHSHSGGSHGSSHSHSSSRSGGGGFRSHSSHSSIGHSSYHHTTVNNYGYSSHNSYPYGRYTNTYTRQRDAIYGGGFANIVSTIVVLLIIVAFVVIFLNLVTGGGSSIAASTIVREKVESGNAYINDCVIDEIGWIDNKAKLSKNLQYVYQETGCQPYIYLREFDPSIDTTQAAEEWSQKYYDEHFKENQNVVLYVYFCDEYDEGYGLDTLFVGTQSSIVFDSEAQEIFWNYLDYDWDNWDINDNDGMFVDVFTKTTDRIMTVTTTGKDLVKYAIIFGTVLVTVIAIIVIITKKAKRAKEKAAEDERILNSNIHDMAKSNLEDKYL